MWLNQTWILGNFTFATLACYALIHILQISIGLYLAYRVFITQNPYSIFTHTISFLGSTDANRNPKGWWIFSLTMITTGLLFLPVMNFLYSRLRFISIEGAMMFNIFAWLGAIGLVLIGFLPSNEPPCPHPPRKTVGEIHDIVAITAIMCLFFAICIMGFVLLLPNTTPPIISVGYYIAIIIFSIGIPIRIIWALKCKKDRSLKPFPGIGIYSLPLWEWILFGLLYFLIYWSALIIVK